MKHTLLSILFVMLAASGAAAQSVLGNTLTWNSASFINLYDNAEQTAAFVITTGSNAITLGYDSRSKTFDIVSTSGSWETPGEDGELVCTVSLGTASGTITLARTSGTYTVTVDFSAHPQGMKRRFITSAPTH